ncbi:MAG: hypothetical protein JEZ06_00405 [Anaerolineaceae bacterium]|nr:hypothetical protein [Anaerolineaceae bacterium]
MPTTQENSILNYKNFYRFTISREIANFYAYLNILDEKLEFKRRELSEKIDVTDTNLNELEFNAERRSELINLKVEAEQAKGFTNLLRQSFLTSLYSFMELWLVRECYVDSKRRDGGESYESLKKIKGIEKAKRYFSKVMKSDYSFGESQDWLWITNFQLFRDCIIHRQGSLTGFSDFEAEPKLVKFVNEENGLSLFGVNNNQVFIEYKFCLKALQTIHRFMFELLVS